jgi:CRP-like cAMP-binding protein
VFADVVALTEGLPERSLTGGEVLIEEGHESREVLVLVEGELVVEVDGHVIERHTRPGTFVGETGALLHQPRNATVSAAGPTVIREIGHPEAFFASHAELGIEVARQLAARLHRLRSYVNEVQRQFDDRGDHLELFGEILDRLATSRPIDIEGGSERSPDY